MSANGTGKNTARTVPHPHLDRLVADAAGLGPARVAVAFPCSASAIDAALAAQKLGLIEPLLVGPVRRIEAIAEEKGFDLSGAQLVDAGGDAVAAAQASVALAREGRCELIMKGSLHTDELMAAAVARDSGMRTGRRVSHAFVFDLPACPRPLLMADCVVNINPGLMEKRDIAQNAIDLAHALGIAQPHVAILSAVETVNPAIPGTVEAAALSKMAERGQLTGAVVDGPLAFDVAISRQAADIKGVASPVSGKADLLIVPNLEAGNMLYKELVYFADAECAGIVLGTRVPLVLTSRADSPRARVASCALAVLQARGGVSAAGS